MSIKTRKSFIFLCLGLLAFAWIGYSEEKKIDSYAPVYTKPLTTESLKDPLSRLIEFPFKLIKWPLDQGIIYTENHRLDKKTKWLYEQSVKQGVKPLFGFVDVSAIPFYGAEMNLLALSRQKEKFPDLFATTTLLHCPAIFFAVGSEIGAQKIGGTGLHAKGVFNYDRQEKEPFYGIGPHTSLGDSTSYRMEATRVGTVAGYEFSPTIDLTGGFDYKKVNILNRAHDGKGDIKTIFAGQNIPGTGGDDLLEYSLTLGRDTRDSKDEATQGSYQKLLFQFTDGVNGSSARFFKYQIDAAKYFRLASPRRILAARLFAEHNEKIDHGNIPFYNMAKLGGSGTNVRESETARAFVYNRFYGESALLLNLEYRYTVMEYKDFKAKAAFFSDTGEVFGEIHEFRLKDLRESYGIGLYISYANNTLLNFSIAHGNEGTQFYIKNKLAF
ncbi:MAG: BamA/TamA family outer membrane protein [Candidatus Omnitrophota bacterium]